MNDDDVCINEHVINYVLADEKRGKDYFQLSRLEFKEVRDARDHPRELTSLLKKDNDGKLRGALTRCLHCPEDYEKDWTNPEQVVISKPKESLIYVKGEEPVTGGKHIYYVKIDYKTADKVLKESIDK